MSRWKAAAVHLLISLVLAASVGALLYLVWFPAPYFVAAGASTLIVLLMGVDVGIGPLLTLLVFNPSKSRRMLRFDLACIAVAQTGALIYGLSVICQARPIFIVATVDRLMVITANQLSDTDLAKGSRPEYRLRSWRGPQLVGALPTSGKDTVKIVMQAMAGGKDIDQLPAFYVPYAQVADALMQHARPLSALKPTDAYQRERLRQLQVDASSKGQTLRFLPLQRGKRDYAAIMSTSSQRPVAVLSIDPWVADK